VATLDRLGPPAAAAPSASTWKPRRAIAVALTLAAAIALFQVVQTSSFAHTGQKLQQLEQRRAVVKAQIYDLEAEVAALASLEYTERSARDRLGMVPGKVQGYLAVEIEAPSGPLLPRPLLEPEPMQQPEAEPWWRSLFRALPIP
jgi:hypothetical protein